MGTGQADLGRRGMMQMVNGVLLEHILSSKAFKSYRP